MIKTKQKPFETMEEVNEYFACDPLPCLICGKRYHALHKHVIMTHKIDVETYREMFGIPWRRALISPSLREKQAAVMHQQRADGIIPLRPSDEHIKKIQELSKHRRPPQKAVTKAQSDHALRQHKRSEKLSHRDYEAYLKRVQSGRTLTEVGRDPDMMRRETFTNYCLQHPEFNEKLITVLDNLPLAVQVRGQRVGTSCKELVIFMRDVQGKRWPQIASLLCTDEATVRSLYHRIKHNGELATLRAGLQKKMLSPV